MEAIRLLRPIDPRPAVEKHGGRFGSTGCVADEEKQQDEEEEGQQTQLENDNSHGCVSAGCVPAQQTGHPTASSAVEAVRRSFEAGRLHEKQQDQERRLRGRKGMQEVYPEPVTTEPKLYPEPVTTEPKLYSVFVTTEHKFYSVFVTTEPKL